MASLKVSNYHSWNFLEDNMLMYSEGASTRLRQPPTACVLISNTFQLNISVSLKSRPSDKSSQERQCPSLEYGYSSSGSGTKRAGRRRVEHTLCAPSQKCWFEEGP